MAKFERPKPLVALESIYDWPLLPSEEPDEVDVAFYGWALKVHDEIQPVYDALYAPLPEDPVLLDEKITVDIDGWAPRVAALMVRSEWFLNKAKKTKWPAKAPGPDGKPTTEADRAAIYQDALADYRFVRDELENMLVRMVDRVRWAQSARKVNANAQ